MKHYVSFMYIYKNEFRTDFFFIDHDEIKTKDDLADIMTKIEDILYTEYEIITHKIRILGITKLPEEPTE